MEQKLGQNRDNLVGCSGRSKGELVLVLTEFWFFDHKSCSHIRFRPSSDMQGVQQEVFPGGPGCGGAQRERRRPRGEGVLLPLLPPRLPHPLPQVPAF